ncbi:hypothetical protein MAR_006166 [Mya arenaria]|uniref:Transposase n=1 Tax=Mya arenaria TaxID=6604 RepID=A0ABY7DF95_MYAAR|nr:hypothetical protein MAR_006166 [Mya arenaria]
MQLLSMKRGQRKSVCLQRVLEQSFEPKQTSSRHQKSSGVEPNPGPATARGRGGQRCAASTTATDPLSVSTAGAMGGPDFQQQPSARGDRATRRSELPLSQTSVSTWLQTGNSRDVESLAGFSEDVHGDTDVRDSEPGSELTMTEILLEIRRDVKNMDRKFDTLKKSVADLKKENLVLKEHNIKLSAEVNTLTKKMSIVEESVTSSDLRSEQIEMQLKKNNLKLFNVAESPNEIAAELDDNVRKLVRDDLGIDNSNMSFEDMHRLPGKQSPRPVHVHFANYIDRKTVLSKFRTKRKSTNLPCRISEDLPQRISKARTDLFPFFKECIDSGKLAYFKLDKLVVDGKMYTYCKDSKSPILASK